MSPTASPRGRQRGERKAAPLGYGHRTPVAGRQQPAEDTRLILQRLIGLAIREGSVGSSVQAHGEVHTIADRLERRHQRTGAASRRRQERDTRRVHDRDGFGAHGQHIPHDNAADGAAAQQRVRLHEPLRTVEGIGKQHGLERSLETTRQLPQQVQHPLEALGVLPQAVEESRVGDFARVEHTGRGADRRQPVADRVCQTAQQFVLNAEPALGPAFQVARPAH